MLAVVAGLRRHGSAHCFAAAGAGVGKLITIAGPQGFMTLSSSTQLAGAHSGGATGGGDNRHSGRDRVGLSPTVRDPTR
ncbi:hypothetical protein KIF59_23655 [Enterobacter cloacae subsp. cloacae]|nr:hypothetical protein [Enterobacter cloacae subsp. cloacae]